MSTATVSRVLAGIGRASPATRARVVEAARVLGYRPSAVARSLRARTTRTLGLIITDIENPFFPQLVRSVEDAARARGFVVLLCNAADDPEREAGYLELLVERRVDGVIIAASSLGIRHREWLADPLLPVVLVNAAPTGLALPAIVSDNRAGGRMGMEHLLGLGHRRLASLMAPPRNQDAPDRLAGARHALAAAGIDPDALAIAVGEAGVAGGERAMHEVLDRDPAVTGVLAYNDLMAIGAMRAIRARGRRIPDDVSVVGFDDVDLAAYVDPPLTTLAQATSEMGRWACERLLSAMPWARPDGDGVGPGDAEVVRLAVELRVRGSTGPAPVDPASRG